MDNNIFNLNHLTFSDNNTILLEIINDLKQTINNSKETITINNLKNIIIKINSIIIENKKNLEIIKSVKTKSNQIYKQFIELNNNNIIDEQMMIK